MEELCNSLCIIAVIGIVIYIIAMIYEAVDKARKDKEGRIRSNTDTISQNEAAFQNAITSFCTSTNRNANAVYSSLLGYINTIKDANVRLIKDAPESGKDRLISELTRKAEQFKQLTDRATNIRTMVNSKNYGGIDKSYWNEIRAMDAATVDRTIGDYHTWLKNGQVDKFPYIEWEKISAMVWFYATEKPYSAQKFAAARETFFCVYKGRFIDLTIAEFYAIKQMGGDDVLRNRIRELLKAHSAPGFELSTEELTMLASGLMWMSAYTEENEVLQYMLSSGRQMTPKTQERLHSLSNGGGNAPAGLDVVSDRKNLYFDVSALAWKDEEYNGLFENLAFQDKLMTYSLAVRDEDKELLISQGIQVPDLSAILKQIRTAFSRDYGGSADATLMNCFALSGSNQEPMVCILAQSQDCRQMGLLMHIVRIGKKLTIKFYTLFMPMGTNLAEQKQQALSLLKKLSPTVTSWESSMKDLSLEAVQQLLNSASQEPERVPLVDEDSGKKEVPIF